jgi:hypothetical protein
MLVSRLWEPFTANPIIEVRYSSKIIFTAGSHVRAEEQPFKHNQKLVILRVAFVEIKPCALLFPSAKLIDES